ncbi:cysteine desulfurase [Marinicauda algicola]|uniref:Cysteine desulfurase n=1 Tax=Marinicauda algicola TaxID=2029849 RepID=A0A4S2H2N2_9PROT|nr:cysteine desulfurase family protein [Marinicauda algicola]TGY89591.1 cysteine desulfurase [Marinicauda algicola]
MTVYLDHNATAPIRPEALDAVMQALARTGNPSSVHGAGRAAKALVERAREIIARAVRARAEDIVFTSGGTEANNLALFSAKDAGVKRLIVSAIEHDAVMDAARATGLPVEILPVTADGVADLSWLENRLKDWNAADGVPFVSLMAANNETGVIQPVEAAGRLVAEAEGLFHVDAVQALGKIDYDVAGTLAHYTAFSAHKVGGPQGVGALALACDAPVSRLLHGGGQEKGRRCGTENVGGIAGFAAAVEAAYAAPQEAAHVRALRDRAEEIIKAAAADVKIWGERAERLPNTLCLSAPGWNSEIQVIAMDLAGFAVSAGAACSSGKVRKSRVLEAMGASPEEAASALRVSFGPGNTLEEAESFANAWLQARARARPKLAAAG